MSKTDRSDGVYLLHIVESLQDVLDFLAGKDYEEFIDSKLLIKNFVPDTLPKLKALPEYDSIIKILG